MHRYHYPWVGLCICLCLFYVLKLQTQFAWSDFCIAVGFVLSVFVALVNTKLVWPYGATEEDQPKVSYVLCRNLQAFACVLILFGGVSNLFF